MWMLGIVCMLASCAKNEEEPTLSVTPTGEVILSQDGSTPSLLTVKTNQDDFDYTCDADWLKVKKEKDGLELSATRADASRSTQLTIRAGSAVPVTVTVSQKELKIGDYYQGGIVFWLNPDKEATPVGKVITLRELNKKDVAEIEDKVGTTFGMDKRRFLCAYQSPNKSEQPTDKDKYNAALANLTDNAWGTNSETDGSSNTRYILQLLDEAAAAKAFSWDYIDCPTSYSMTYFGTCEVTWFRKHILEAKEGGYDDWYIPAIDELKELLKEDPTTKKRLYDVLNESILKQGGDPINGIWNMQEYGWKTVYYASSSEDRSENYTDRIYVIQFKPTYVGDVENIVTYKGKSRLNCVIRAIRQF